MYCFIFRPSSFIFTGLIISYTLLVLPLCILIFYHGLHEWCRKRSTSSAAPMCSSNCFAYHLAAMDTIGIFGLSLSFCGMYREDLYILSVGILLASFILSGETLFQVLMCVDRYLAVVHPIAYLNLRNERGIRIRNITVGSVWITSVAVMGLLMNEKIFSVLDLFVLMLALITASFCSLSVLCVLIRPGPGEQGGGREKVDQSKLRAFYTIVAILGVLVLRFGWGLARAVTVVSDASYVCTVMTSGFFFYLPSSLVSPILFLHRVGKSVCCK